MAVRVVTDSVSDIPPDMAAELDITIVPAYVRFGNDVYKDGVELTTDQFFDKLFNGPDFPATSQPSVGDFSETYERVADGADGIVSIHVSSKLSGTINSAQQGSGVADVGCPIEIVDTLQASFASGVVAVAAARVAQAGGSLEEAVAAARDAAPRAHCFALLDTLEYLEKGGRIGKAQAMLGGLLKIKPIISIEDGVVENFAKERTSRKAMARLHQAIEDIAPIQMGAVMYSTDRRPAERLAAEINATLDGGEEIQVLRFGAALGAYVGPNAVGLGVMRG